jgi:hypothetical protein
LPDPTGDNRRLPGAADAAEIAADPAPPVDDEELQVIHPESMDPIADSVTRKAWTPGGVGTPR